MEYSYLYQTPAGLDNLILQSDGEYLTAVRFICAQDETMPPSSIVTPHIFSSAKAWFDTYFQGGTAQFTPKYKLENLTPFCRSVLDIVKAIPYGKTVTYGNIAKEIALKKGLEKMSAQAVGRAVGANPICIIIPCHRVVGVGGKLVGYAGGIKNKEKLLKTEAAKKHPYFTV